MAENMMDSDGPTTGKPNAARYMQDAEVRTWPEKAMQRWRLWLVVVVVALVGIYYLSGRSSTDSAAVPTAMAHPIVPVAAIPAKLGEQVTQRLRIPTIGIGAGPGCSGQVLVLHDMLDVFPGKKARFVRNFMKGASGIADAAERYVRAVRDGSFPAEEHSF